MKLLVPTGYMVENARGSITVSICSGAVSRTMTIDVAGLHGDTGDRGKSAEHGKAEMPCAFSGLSAAILGPVDPVQLAALIAFILTVGLVATSLPARSRPAYLRPPLRGPPAHL